MNKFLEKHNFLRLNQEEIENIIRPITSTEIETVIKNLPNNQWIKEEITSEIRKYFEINEIENTTYQNLWDAAKAFIEILCDTTISLLDIYPKENICA